MAGESSVDAGTGADRKAKGPKHTPRTEKPRGRRKTAIGYVVSDKMQKTIVVELEDRVRHPLYGKIIRTTTKVKAHDENGDRRHRRPRLVDGDPPAVGDQALAARRDPRARQVGSRKRQNAEAPNTRCSGLLVSGSCVTR